MSDWLAGLPPDTLTLLLSPWVLAVLGLAVGSFLNVVVHRLPLMLERQWWGDVAAQLGDTASFKRVFASDAPERLVLASGSLEKAIGDLAPLGLARPPSRCPSCGTRIRFYQNIPVLSWLALGGRCSACNTRISARYPLVELGTALMFAAIAWRLGPVPSTLMWCAVAAVLLALYCVALMLVQLPSDPVTRMR